MYYTEKVNDFNYLFYLKLEIYAKRTSPYPASPTPPPSPPHHVARHQLHCFVHLELSQHLQHAPQAPCDPVQGADGACVHAGVS